MTLGSDPTAGLPVLQEALYDVVIVGLGPAAITAAVYSFRKRVKTLLIGKDFGGAVLISGEIENWPGMVHTDGIELSQKLEEQVKKYCTDDSCFDQSLVTKIEKAGNLFRVHADTSRVYQTRTVIYTTGRRPKKLGVPGEEQYRNKGVTYCATCDGPLFHGKDVVIIGGGNAAMEAALMMKNIAKHVTVVTINPELMGDQIYIEQLTKAAQDGGNVRVIYSGATSEVKGDGTFATSIVVKDTKRGASEEIPVRGVFVEIGSLPIIDPVRELGLTLNSYEDILVNRLCETNIPGFFAAGDVTDIRDKQIVVAAGMGCTAALSAGEYLIKNS